MPTPTSPAPFQRARPALRAAAAGLSARTLALLLVFLAVFALSRGILGVAEAVRAGQFALWLTDTVTDFALIVAVILPVVGAVNTVQNAGPAQGVWRVACLSLTVVLATLAGLLLRRFILMAINPDYLTWSDWLTLLPGFWVEYAFIGTGYGVITEFVRREQESIAAMHRAELNRLALQREMDAARMSVLQAQIEPHFLFNTLANVRRLFQTDSTAARVMLDNLMRYFAIALPRMRNDTTDLSREAELIDAYLRIQQIRMGRRLAFNLDIPPPLPALAVPPMMLLTLVENAVKHGLNPLPEGGAITVRARRDGASLLLEVADSGRGFREGSGGGTGLANIRARLAAEFGSTAALSFHGNAPRGVVATVTLPMPVDAP